MNSPGVSGSSPSSMVSSTVTKGTCATTARKRSGRKFMHAPTSMPPADPPQMAMLPLRV